MNLYKTADIARLNRIHPNTVRLYEQFGFIPKPARQANGYRAFTDLHLEQTRLVRMALGIEVLQNGLRKKAIGLVKAAASGDYELAIRLAEEYLAQIMVEQAHAEEAIGIVEGLLSDSRPEGSGAGLTRQETADCLHISMDALRNWEMNGLLEVKRMQNGYRIYTDDDLRRLKIIRSLRCANYSLAAILRMLNSLSGNTPADIRKTIDTPGADDEIVTACDTLLTSLGHAEQNARSMLAHLTHMKNRFQPNPPL